MRATPFQLGRLVMPPGLFRLCLAYVVVLDHFSPLQLGGAAVYAFFMLSGFWVYRMWFEEYAPAAHPYATFIVSRIWRLLPVYYVALLAALAIDFAFPSNHLGFTPAPGWDAVHFTLSHLFILGYATLPQAEKPLFPVWSLDIELQFYLVAPLLIAFAARSSRAWARVVLLALALAGLAFFVTFYAGANLWGNNNSAFLPMYLIFFLVGVASAHFDWKPRPALALGGLAVALCIVAVCILLPATRELVYFHKVHGALASYNTMVNIVLAFLISSYAMATVRRVPTNGTWLARADRDLGNVSYEIYLLHTDALWIVDLCCAHLSRQARLPALAFAGLALLPVAWLVYRWADAPLDRLRRAWVKSRPRRSDASTAVASIATGAAK